MRRQNRNVSMESDALHKRVLFETWVEAHQDAPATLALTGEPIDRRRFLARVASLAGQQRDDDYVYLLLERRPSEETPAYIGRAVSPIRRWMEHLIRIPINSSSLATSGSLSRL